MAFSILGQLKLDGSSFHGELNRAKAATAAFGRSLSQSIGSGLKGQLASFIGVGALTLASKNAIDYGSKIHDLSLRLGVSTDALQEFDYAARLNGATLDDFAGSLQRLAVNRKAALDDPAGDMARAFANLGFSIDDLKSKRLEDLFKQIGVGFKNAADPQEKMAEMIQVLGRGSPAVFAAMREGLGEMGDEAKRLGLILEKSVIEELDKMGDTVTTLMKRFTAFFAPVITMVGKFANAWLDGAAVIIAAMSSVGAVWASVFSGVPIKTAIEEAKKQLAAELEEIGRRIEARDRPRAAVEPVHVDIEGDDTKKQAQAKKTADDILKLREKIHGLELDGLSVTERRKRIEEEIAAVKRKLADEAKTRVFGPETQEAEKARLEKQAKLLDLEKDLRGLKGDGKPLATDALAKIGGIRGGGNPFAQPVQDIRTRLARIEANTAKGAAAGQRAAAALGD